MKKIAIICFTDYTREPRVLRTIHALQNSFNLKIYSHKNTIHNIPCSDIVSLNEDSPEVTFHKNFPAFLKKLVGLFLKLLSLYNNGSDSFYRKKYWSKKRKKLFQIIAAENYDLVIGHGIYTLPLLSELKCKTIFNAHEYYLKEFEENEMWVRYTQPYYFFILKTYLKNINLMFCVSELILKEYKKQFDVAAIEITNATAYYNLNPSPVQSKIRIIHHGAAIRTRQLELMAKTMDYLPENYELYFMLVPTDEAYLSELINTYSNSSRIKFIEPVKVENISIECNKYDIGLFILPPVNFNWMCALPNKLFEYIQGRLCVVVSPNPDMRRIVEENNIGVVADEYTPQSAANVILKLSREDIATFKNNCNACAMKYNAEKTEKEMLSQIHKLIS